jgi:hypothetical protein
VPTEKYGVAGRGLDAALWALVLGLLALTFFKHATLCSFPFQEDPTEGGMLQSARVLAHGGDPWAPAIAPESFNAYGWGYPWVAAQWHRLQPDLPWLLLLRLTTAVGIWGALGLLWLAMKEGGVSLMVRAAALALFYPVLLFPATYTARPDGLGTVFYLAVLVWIQRPGWRNFSFAGALGAVAYFIKTYMVLALPIGALTLWMQGRRKDAGGLLLSGLVGGLLLGSLVLWRHPHYLEGTLLVNARVQDLDPRSAAWAWRQLRDLLQLHAVLALTAPLALFWAWRLFAATERRRPPLGLGGRGRRHLLGCGHGQSRRGLPALLRPTAAALSFSGGHLLLETVGLVVAGSGGLAGLGGHHADHGHAQLDAP